MLRVWERSAPGPSEVLFEEEAVGDVEGVVGAQVEVGSVLAGGAVLEPTRGS